jgi:hypothetical protein
MDAVTLSIIIGGLLALSEMLSLIPGVKANSIFQMLWNMLKLLAGEKEPKQGT